MEDSQIFDFIDQKDIVSVTVNFVSGMTVANRQSETTYLQTPDIVTIPVGVKMTRVRQSLSHNDCIWSELTDEQIVAQKLGVPDGSLELVRVNGKLALKANRDNTSRRKMVDQLLEQGRPLRSPDDVVRRSTDARPDPLDRDDPPKQHLNLGTRARNRLDSSDKIRPPARRGPSGRNQRF